MRIGIFVVMAGRQAGGPETYELNLIRELLKRDNKNEYHIFCLGKHAKDAVKIEKTNIHYHILWPKLRVISVLFSLPISLLINKIDIYHATFTPPPISPIPFIFTNHCFSNFQHPEFYPPKIRYRLNKLITKGIKKSKLIICVSENIRELTAKKFNLPPERLAVVYHGVDKQFKPINEEKVRDALEQNFGITTPYILFAGKLEARKNIVRLIEAFATCRDKMNTDIKLVLAGRRTWEPEVIEQKIDQLGIKDHIIEIGHVDNSDMPLLYNGAELFAFPSLWEGFGIPIIESMACGTPVVTSNNSCIPEVTGGAALLIDPYDVEDIATAFYTILTDVKTKNELIDKGIQRAKSFTWEKTAQQTLDAYEKVAKHANIKS